MTGLLYAREKLIVAVDVLATRDAPLRERLYAAFIVMIALKAEDFPSGPMRTLWKGIRDDLSWNPAAGDEGTLRATLRIMDDDEAQAIVRRCDALSPRMVRVIEDLAGDWRRLDERIEGLSGEIGALARHDVGCARLMSVPGIGPIISSAMVAAVGTGEAFSKDRDFAAWLGLVPRQISTGDRTILGKISKRGNRYLRVLFVQAAWAVLIKPKSWERHGLKPWIEATKRRLHHNVLAIALANKLARIAWSVLAHGRNFEARSLQEATAQPA